MRLFGLNRRRLNWAVMAAALSCVLAGCGGSLAAGGAPAAKPELTKISVGALPIVDSASIYIAIKNGYFAAEGLDVDVKTLASGADAVPGLRDEKLQFALGNYVSFFAAQVAGDLDVKLVADAYQAQPGTFLLMVNGNAAVRRPADLAGKKIAVNTRNNVVELTARSSLSTAGVDVNSVTFVPIPFPNMSAALINKSVDAALMVEPYVTQAEKDHGAIPLLDAASGPTAQLPIAAWVTSGKIAREKPNTVKAFQRAIIKGQLAAASNRSQVEQVLREYLKVDDLTANLMALGTWPSTLEVSRIQRVVDLMSAAGQLTKPLDVRPMIIPPPAS